MQPRVDRHRLTFVLLAWLGGAPVCFAQDVARMDQVVQSYVSNEPSPVPCSSPAAAT